MSFLILASVLLACLKFLEAFGRSSLSGKEIARGCLFYLLVAIPMSVLFNAAGRHEQLATLVTITIVVPLIEELVRFLAIRKSVALDAAKLVGFGFGWGSVEAVIKVADIENQSKFNLITTLSVDDVLWIVLIGFTCMLHILLTLVIGFGVKRGSALSFFACAFLLHSMHNLFATHFSTSKSILAGLLIVEALLCFVLVRKVSRLDNAMPAPTSAPS